MGNVPSLPRLLGLAGLLPQLAMLGVVMLAAPNEWRDTAIAIAALYAGLILSFLGGTWWGIAAAAPAAERRKALGWVWWAAVLASLLGFGALVLPLVGGPWPQPSLVMLGSALLLSPIVDARLATTGIAPPWWTRLRVPLSLGLGGVTFALGVIA